MVVQWIEALMASFIHVLYLVLYLFQVQYIFIIYIIHAEHVF